MNILLIFVAAVTVMIALYMMNRFIKRPGFGSILVLIVQLLSVTVTVFSIFENVFTTPQVELAIILTGVVFPIPVLVYDHITFAKRIKKLGLNIHLVEKKIKDNPRKWSVQFFTESVELWKEEIQAMDVYRRLSVQDAQMRENVKKQLIRIQHFIKLGRYETAAEQYRMLHSLFPGSASIAYNTGYLHCYIGKHREAYKILRNAQTAIKREKDAAKHGSGVKQDSGDNEHDTVQGKVQLLPVELEAMIQFYMGYALYHLGKHEHAIRHFQKVLKTKPDLAVVYKNIARAFLSMDMNEKAVEYLEKGRLDLRDSAMRIVLGSIYYHQGDTKKAVEVLDEVAAADEKQIEALKWGGRAALKEKMHDKAIECFKALIQIDPSEPSHYYHLALAQRALGENANALKTYERGISEHPLSGMLLYHAGTLLDEMGEREKAVQTLYKALDGDEASEDTLNYLGVLLGQMKRYRESVQVFDKGIQNFHKSFQLHFNRGIVLEMARRLEDAVYSFEKAYAINPNDSVLIYHYAAVLLKVRDYAKAIRICKQGLNNYPNDTELIYGLSKVYSLMGEKEIAIDLLKKVLALDPVYLSRLRQDLDFKALENHPGYQSLLVS